MGGLVEVPTVPAELEAVSQPVDPRNDYRRVRCDELRESPQSFPSETFVRDFRELECDTLPGG